MKVHQHTKVFSSGVFTVVVVYAVFSGLWILLSDKAMGLLIGDPESLVKASMAKGWLFVAVTSLLLYYLVRRLVGEMRRAYRCEIEAHEERQRSLDLLNAIVENTDDAIFAKDSAGRYLLFNAAAVRLVGKPATEVLGRDDRSLFPPEQAAKIMEIGRRVLASGEIETNEEILDTTRGRRVFLATKGPLRDAGKQVFGIFGISRDITERKLADLARDDSERRFHDIAQVSADWIWEVDAEARYTYVSDSVQALLGYSPAEILGKTPFDLMPADEAERLRVEFMAVAARKAMFRDLDNINLHKDGSLRHVQTNGMPILAPDGTLLGYRGLDRDVTGKKRAERELREARVQMRALVNAIPDLIWLKDAEGCYLACNPRFEQFFGATEAEIIGKTDYDFVPRELADLFRTNDLAASTAGAPLVNEEEVVFASDGHREILQTIKTPFHARDGQIIGVLGIARDISDRKTAEGELRQRNAELERFNRATVGREIDMIAMKKTINKLLAELGRPPQYPLGFLKDRGDKADQ